jgi:hypothetical protein
MSLSSTGPFLPIVTGSQVCRPFIRPTARYAEEAAAFIEAVRTVRETRRSSGGNWEAETVSSAVLMLRRLDEL